MAVLLLDQWLVVYGSAPVYADPAAQAAETFRDRISIAATAAAIAIANEALATVNHANRVALAKLVADSPGLWVYPFAQSLASQGLDHSATDAQINAGVSTVWNTL